MSGVLTCQETLPHDGPDTEEKGGRAAPQGVQHVEQGREDSDAATLRGRSMGSTIGAKGACGCAGRCDEEARIGNRVLEREVDR